MHANSRPVSSNQQDIHADLQRQLQRHLHSPFRRPIALHTQIAFDQFLARWDKLARPPIVLDAGCGTGWSSLALSEKHPECLVVGVDQSAERLGRSPPAHGRLLLLRADVVDIWRLLTDQNIRLAHHYLLYPNPWPKKHHLGRRWHGHAAFPVALSLGGVIECRSNWALYVQEFAHALQVLTGAEVQARPLSEPELAIPLTPFEDKYKASGHELWRCSLDLDACAFALPSTDFAARC